MQASWEPSGKRLPAKRAVIIALSAVAVILVLGLVHLRYPFWGDQALYTVGAQELHSGAVMYRDFWDLKQPGIYYFFLFAGTLFGFNERGVHLLEALYQTAFAAVLVVAFAHTFSQRWLAGVVPILTIAVYYALADPPTLTSVEALVGFPLFVCAWLSATAVEARRERTLRGFGSGLMAAAVITLKLAFLPVAIALWIAAAIAIRHGCAMREAGIFAGAVLAGLLLPLALLAAHFAANGVLHAAAVTWFVDPGRIARALPHINLRYEIKEFVHFLTMFAPLLALAVVGVWSRRRSLDALLVAMIVWFVVGLSIATAEVWSWTYRFFLILIPIGVLATHGVDAVARFVGRTRSSASRVGTLLVLIGIFVPLAGGLIEHSTAALPPPISILGPRQTTWSLRLFRKSKEVGREVAFLRQPSSRSGDIFVIGDPRYYYFSGRRQAVAINGWSPQLLLPEQWHALATEINARPPAYIYVSADKVTFLSRSPELITLLHTVYTSFHDPVASNGFWYERRSPS